MIIPSKYYDALKWYALTVSPALAVLLVAVDKSTGFDSGDEAAAVILAVGVFLGTILQKSSANFKDSGEAMDGYLGVTGYDELTGHPHLQLTVTTDPAELATQKIAMLKIGTPPPRPPAMVQPIEVEGQEAEEIDED